MVDRASDHRQLLLQLLRTTAQIQFPTVHRRLLTSQLALHVYCWCRPDSARQPQYTLTTYYQTACHKSHIFQLLLYQSVRQKILANK